MLKGKFKNCYGLGDFETCDIPFGEGAGQNSIAVIYAPNGSMKSSFAKVLATLRTRRKQLTCYILKGRPLFP